MSGKLMTARKAAEYVGLSYGMFRKLVKEGKIPYHTDTKKFNRTSLDIWLNKESYHTDFTKEATHGTRISRSLSTESEYNFEKVRDMLITKWRKNSA